MARKVTAPRSASGAGAVAWVLLGFVLGAGLAVFALLNADFLIGPTTPFAAEAPQPAAVAAAQPPPSAPAAEPEIPAPTTTPALAEQAAPAPSPASSPSSATPPPYAAPSARPTAPETLASASDARTDAAGGEASDTDEAALPPPVPRVRTSRAPPAADPDQVADDAAAAGLTSRAGPDDVD